MRILVAEDDASMAEFLRDSLCREHFFVRIAVDGTEAQSLLSETPFDLLLLDLKLPGINGFEVLRAARSCKPDLPVLILTGSDSMEERVCALDMGADDFVIKPFAFCELHARIRAILRRGSRPSRSQLTVDDLELDRVSHTVRRGCRDIALSPKEFGVLEFLMRQPGQPISRLLIAQQIWHINREATTNVVDVYINYLRRKVDGQGGRPLIQTVRGVGYQIGGVISAAGSP